MKIRYLIIFILLLTCNISLVISDEQLSPVNSALFDFNSLTDLSLWSKKSWKDEGVVYKWEDSGGINNSPCLSIENIIGYPNDSMLFIDIPMENDEWYKLSGWIKSKDIMHYELGQYDFDFIVGANFCIVDTWDYVTTENTDDWVFIQRTFKYSSGMNIACRLGYWCDTVTGKAFFDDLRIDKIEINEKLIGKYIGFIIEREDTKNLSMDKLQNWVSLLDQCYEVLSDFTGYIPNESNPIEIVSVEYNPGGLAVAGFPILWMREYIRDELISVIENGDWSFVMNHEISHDFDRDSWNFDAEHFANFKLCYALERLNGRVKYQDSFLVGIEIQKIFFFQNAKAMKYFIDTGEYQDFSDVITYWFLQIKNRIGWDPFIATFHEYENLDVSEDLNRNEKFHLFMKILQDHSLENIELIMPEEVRQCIEDFLKN